MAGAALRVGLGVCQDVWALSAVLWPLGDAAVELSRQVELAVLDVGGERFLLGIGEGQRRTGWFLGVADGADVADLGDFYAVVASTAAAALAPGRVGEVRVADHFSPFSSVPISSAEVAGGRAESDMRSQARL